MTKFDTKMTKFDTLYYKFIEFWQLILTYSDILK